MGVGYGSLCEVFFSARLANAEAVKELLIVCACGANSYMILLQLRQRVGHILASLYGHAASHCRQ